MDKNSSATTAGVSFFDLLAVLFIGLKLAGVITWPWIWVLSPFWIEILIIIITLFLIWMKLKDLLFAGWMIVIAVLLGSFFLFVIL